MTRATAARARHRSRPGTTGESPVTPRSSSIPCRWGTPTIPLALPTPLGSTVMLNPLSEWLRFEDGTRREIGGWDRAVGGLEWPGARYLVEFRLESGLPVWRYDLSGVRIEKRVLMPHQQNTVHVSYRLLSGSGPVRLKLRPALHFRPLEGSVHDAMAEPRTITAVDDRLELS